MNRIRYEFWLEGFIVCAGLFACGMLGFLTLMLRDVKGAYLGTLHPSDIVLFGEDGIMRIYSEDKFRLMYDVI